MKFIPRHAALCLVLATLPACKRVEERMEITETREVSTYARKPSPDVPSSARFFDEDKNEPKENPLVWKSPEGWKEGRASQMRLIDFKFGPADEGECYLSAMPGPAGGLVANINRWRTQMGQPPLTDAEIDKLPRKPLMGGESHFVVVDGAFKGMGAESAKTGYRLLGLIQQAPELTIFVKMTGPKDLVDQNTAAFDAFCASVQFRGKTEKVPSH